MTAASKVRQRRAALLLKAQRGLCGRCHLPVVEYGGLHDSAGTLDHVVPKSKGGKNVLKNLLVMHRKCNAAKGDRPFKAHDFHAAVLRRLEQAQKPGPG